MEAADQANVIPDRPTSDLFAYLSYTSQFLSFRQAVFVLPMPMNTAFNTCHTMPIVNPTFPVPYSCGRSPVSVMTKPISATGPGNRPPSLAYAATRSLPLVMPPAVPVSPFSLLTTPRSQNKERNSPLLQIFPSFTHLIFSPTQSTPSNFFARSPCSPLGPQAFLPFNRPAAPHK